MIEFLLGLIEEASEQERSSGVRVKGSPWQFLVSNQQEGKNHDCGYDVSERDRSLADISRTRPRSDQGEADGSRRGGGMDP